MVTIAPNSDQNFKKYLNTKEPVDGYSIASIEWSERVGATKVTISKDGKFGTLTFNQALLSKSASRSPAGSRSDCPKVCLWSLLQARVKPLMPACVPRFSATQEPWATPRRISCLRK